MNHCLFAAVLSLIIILFTGYSAQQDTGRPNTTYRMEFGSEENEETEPCRHIMVVHKDRGFYRIATAGVLAYPMSGYSVQWVHSPGENHRQTSPSTLLLLIAHTLYAQAAL